MQLCILMQKRKKSEFYNFSVTKISYVPFNIKKQSYLDKENFLLIFWGYKILKSICLFSCKFLYEIVWAD